MKGKKGYPASINFIFAPYKDLVAKLYARYQLLFITRTPACTLPSAWNLARNITKHPNIPLIAEATNVLDRNDISISTAYL